MSDVPAPARVSAPPAFDDVYRTWFDRVVRWLPAMGVARADLEDVAQEVFVIVERRLGGFEGEQLGSWLYAIALRVAGNHRRLAWFRRILLSPVEPALQAVSDPERDLARAQRVRQAEQVLDGMSAALRRAFVLFEVEGYSGEEIAQLEQIPVATVWTRLHHARKAFAAGAAALRAREER